MLIAERTKQGVSQRELADRLGMARSYVSRVETCERNIAVTDFIDLAHALGVDPRPLFGELLDRLAAEITR